MFRNERVIIVDVQLGALAAPTRPLGDSQRHQKVSAKEYVDENLVHFKTIRLRAAPSLTV